MNGMDGCRDRACKVKWPHYPGKMGGCPAADGVASRALVPVPSRALGSPEEPPQGIVDAFVEQIKALLDAGPQRFARYMIDLQRVISDNRDARDTFLAIGTDDAAVGAWNAEEARRKAQGVYDALANVVYRAWPDIGLGGPGRMGIAFLALLPFIIEAAKVIALILGGVSLWTWLDTSRQTAQANRTLAETAQRTCAADPNSPACLAALRTAAAGVPQPAGGLTDAIGGVGKIVLWGALAFLAYKILTMIGEERKARRALPAPAAA